MGCDIHSIAVDASGQTVSSKGAWADGGEPFRWRHYGVFAFLAGVRNYYGVTPISQQRDIPVDVKYDDGSYSLGEHSFSWLYVKELAEFDYDVTFYDKRSDEHTTLREFLGPDFFHDVAELQRIGADRVVFGFDC